MSAPGDHFNEMSGCEPVDDATLDALLDDVRSYVRSTPVPEPSPELALVLATGLSTEKGELLARAASNVTGPAEQASGLPKWRQEEVMGTGMLSGLFGKLAGAGLPAKLLMAFGITLTGVTAGAGAGALPGPVQSTVAGVVNTVSPFDFPSGHSSTGVQVAASVPGGGQASVQVGENTGTGDNNTGTSVTVNASTPAPTVHTAPEADESGDTPDVTIPPIDPSSILSHLPSQVPSCVTSIVDSAGHVVASPTALASQVLSCVNQLIPQGVVPTSISNCISSILNSVGSAVGSGTPTSIPQLNISSCVPVDVSQCASSIMSQFGSPAAILGSLSKFGSMFGFSNLTNLTSLGDLHGCVPFNLDACISSILGSAPGGLANLNLSSCVPANLIGNLPFPFGQH